MSQYDFAGLTKFFDNFYGVIGFNDMLRRSLLETIRNMAKNRPYFSNTTYAIIYKLIKNQKIGIFFSPRIRITKFHITDNPINVVGGYDFNSKRINIFVKWTYGLDVFQEAVDNNMHLVCLKIFAILLSEALLIYNHNNNGVLANHDAIKTWYNVYLELAIYSTINKSKTASDVALMASEVYGPTVYNKVEKAIMENRSPAIKIENKGNNPELDIEGIPSIKKGEKVLRDVFGDIIEDIIIHNYDELHLNNFSFDSLKEFIDDYGEFCAFLYRNRDLHFSPTNLEAMPENIADTFKDTSRNKSKTIAKLRGLDKEEHQEKIQSMISSNPLAKKNLDEKEKAEFIKQYGKEAYMKKFVDDTVITSGNTFISRYMLDGPVTLKDLNNAINGTVNSISALKSLIEKASNDHTTDREKIVGMITSQKDTAESNYTDLLKLFKKVTKGTDNEAYFNGLINQNGRNTNLSNNTLSVLDKMKELVQRQNNINQTKKTLSNDKSLLGEQKKLIGNISRLRNMISYRDTSNTIGNNISNRDAIDIVAREIQTQLIKNVTVSSYHKLLPTLTQREDRVIISTLTNNSANNNLKAINKIRDRVNNALTTYNNNDISPEIKAQYQQRTSRLTNNFNFLPSTPNEYDSKFKLYCRTRGTRPNAASRADFNRMINNIAKDTHELLKNFSLEFNKKEILSKDSHYLSNNILTGNRTLRSLSHEDIRRYKKHLLKSLSNKEQGRITDREILTALTGIPQNQHFSEDQLKALMKLGNTAIDSYIRNATNAGRNVLYVVEDRPKSKKEKYGLIDFLTGLTSAITTGFKDATTAWKWLKSSYNFAKLVLPFQSNINKYANAAFGFGPMASMAIFDLAYKKTFKIKKVYELNKGTCKRDMVYCELYMPTTILAKYLFTQLTTGGQYDSVILQLITYANRGLEYFL